MPVHPLIKLFIVTARELERREVWKALRQEEIPIAVLRRAPQPYAVLMLEGEGKEGLGVSAIPGTHGFHRLASAFVSGGREPGLRIETVHVLGMMLKRWSDLSFDARRFLRAHGVPKPEKGKLLPEIVIQHPYGRPQLPQHEDVIRLTLILQGLLHAHVSGELHLEPGVFASRRTLEIEIDGEPDEPEVKTRIVPWPEPNSTVDPRAFPEDLADLPRLDERWMILTLGPGNPGMPEMFAEFEIAYVLRRGGLPEVGVVFLQGEAAMDVASHLVQAFRGGHGTPTGLPSEISFNDEVLHRRLQPALEALGIESAYSSDDPEMLEQIAKIEADRKELGQEFPTADWEDDEDEDEDDDEDDDEDAGSQKEEDYDLAVTPTTLEEWKHASRTVRYLLHDDVIARGKNTPRAWKRFFGPVREFGELMNLLERDCYLEWLFADYRTSSGAPTLVEAFLRRADLPPAHRALLEARRDAVVSIFRALGWPSEGSVEIEDLVHGTRHVIHDEDFASAAKEGYVFAARRVVVDGHELLYPVSPPFSGMTLDDLLDLLEAEGYPRSSAGTRKDVHVFGRLWS